jgi:hypothetical protein
MKSKRIGFAILLTICFTAMGSAQQVTFDKVKARFSKSAKDRRLVDKSADLIFDDTARKLTVRCVQHPLDIGYDAVQRVVFDVSHHMRGGNLGAAIGGLVGAAIMSKHVNDYWFYLEYEDSQGKVIPYMLEIDKESSPQVIEKAQASFPGKVTVADFPEKEEKIDKATLKALQTKHSLKVDKVNHPLPELKPDKALVVVVCPPLDARSAGHGVQYKFHANDEVVAVNLMGTYYFCYLDLGEYQLVSQTENASGFRMKLEAGQDYYFLQNTFMGAWKARTTLSRQTKELTMYELQGAYWSDWKLKK